MLSILLSCSGPVSSGTYLAVVATSPPHGAVNVPRDTEVRAVLSERVDESSLGVDDIGLLTPEGTEVTAGLFVDSGTNTIRLVPANSLDAGVEYRLLLGADIRASSGNSLGAPVEASFRTGGALSESGKDSGTDTGTD
ncbi:MAG TPA: Ig-like domain-containing protein [Myxococcota bacterium]|nr:Ig-like domain-containing protein [Myxococcota bacterium]